MIVKQVIKTLLKNQQTNHKKVVKIYLLMVLKEKMYHQLLQ